MYKRSRESDASSSSDDEAAHDTQGASPQLASSQPLKREAIEISTPDEPVVTCNLPPRCDRKPRQFWSADAYERHYRQRHAHACLECGARFPSAHLSDLHAEEMHDSLFAVRVDRGELAYRCLAETCADRFASTTQRRKHLLATHKYPEEFRFNITRKGLDAKAQSLLYPPDLASTKSPNAAKPASRTQRHAAVGAQDEADRRTEKTVYATKRAYNAAKSDHALAVEQLMQQLHDETSTSMDDAAAKDTPTPLATSLATPVEAPDTDMDSLTQAFITTRRVPRSVHFGRGKR